MSSENIHKQHDSQWCDGVAETPIFHNHDDVLILSCRGISSPSINAFIISRGAYNSISLVPNPMSWPRRNRGICSRGHTAHWALDYYRAHDQASSDLSTAATVTCEPKANHTTTTS